MTGAVPSHETQEGKPTGNQSQGSKQHPLSGSHENWGTTESRSSPLGDTGALDDGRVQTVLTSQVSREDDCGIYMCVWLEACPLGDTCGEKLIGLVHRESGLLSLLPLCSAL